MGKHSEAKQESRWNRKTIITAAATAGALLVAGVTALILTRQEGEPETSKYPWHENINTTVFWVGEAADESNGHIHNRSSTWVVEWEEAFGGVDDPERRCDHLPCDFTPKENPFYAALPYNDIDGSCQAKSSQKEIPWYNPNSPTKEGDSEIKNRWLEVVHNGMTAYVQLQDAGPFGEDDFDYVFGDSPPDYEVGLDVSPATASYLKMSGYDQTDWRFVDAEDVPDGPWKQIVTTSPPDCFANRVNY